MMVRLPTRFDTEDSFISRFLCRLANLPAAQLQVVGPSLRLQEGARVPDLWDHVLVYGDDTTVTHFRRILPMPVQGFGGRIGVTIAVASDLDKSATHELVRDALSLGQQGCMATRLTFVHDPQGEVRESAWIGTVAEAMAAFWGSELPLSRRAALDGEAWRLERQNFRCWMGPTVSPKATTVSSFGLIATRVVDLQDLASAVTIEDLAMAPFTLPIILVRGGTTHEYLEEAARLLSGFPPLAACSVTASVLEAAADPAPTPFPWTRFALRPLGHSNAPVWDGRHEGLPLFSADYDKI
jgi:hypothetical protein